MRMFVRALESFCSHLSRRLATCAMIAALGLVPACGGGGGGSTTGGGLVLVDFLQASLDNVQVNTRLEFVFSAPVDPRSIGPDAIQVREGPQFGEQVPGLYRVFGNVVVFTPNLPGQCDLSDSGLGTGRVYSVQVIGDPEEFAVHDTRGRPLRQTSSWSFRTREETDPQRFRDAAPGVQPFLASSSPAQGEQAVPVLQGNRLVMTMNENLNPCTVSGTSVRAQVTQTGDPNTATSVLAPNGRRSGFYSGTDTSDQDPLPGAWGADVSTTLPTPQSLLVDVELVQDFETTQIVVTPRFGEWPDNALIVVELSFAIEDFGGNPLEPFALSFTTENRETSAGTYAMRFEGETPFLQASTADVNTARSRGVAQGHLLITGDGDNGLNHLRPALPFTNAPDCNADPLQDNDGVLDAFDPVADVLLDTGPTNPCSNGVDGSTAVVWEFTTFQIRGGITVRLVGDNPAIILVKGDATIEAGGRLLVRGDGNAGAPAGRGDNGDGSRNANARVPADGGTGVSGGGHGGDSLQVGVGTHGEDGTDGAGSPNAGTPGGLGSGRGNVTATATFVSTGGSPGGGGGGHSEAGLAGGLQTNGTAVHAPSVGAGGGIYPAGPAGQRMEKPSAGSGGGAAGWLNLTQGTFNGDDATGGAGGAGGGFVDLTATGDINVFGEIDAAGSRGGSGGGPTFRATSGGGGGGAGGGIRLLTPNDINLTGGTLTAAGGAGGPGAMPQGNNSLSGPGGNGAPGRIALEDGDSSITGIATATLVPAEGADGFYRGVFDTTRFVGGGRQTVALSDRFAVGPLAPRFAAPVEADFATFTPTVSAGALGDLAIVVEVQGFQMLPDGTADVGSASGYVTVGHFLNSGSELAPAYVSGHPSVGFPRPADNIGSVGTDLLSTLDGFEFLQTRITFVMHGPVGPFDPGPGMDAWTIRFAYDN